MKIEVGDVLKTPCRRLTVVAIYDIYVVAKDMDSGTGNEKYMYETIILLCTKRVWSLEKATKQLDMSGLDEL